MSKDFEEERTLVFKSRYRREDNDRMNTRFNRIHSSYLARVKRICVVGTDLQHNAAGPFDYRHTSDVFRPCASQP